MGAPKDAEATEPAGAVRPRDRPCGAGDETAGVTLGRSWERDKESRRGMGSAGGLCAVSLSSLGDTEVSGRGHVPATAGAKSCPHARQRRSSASSPTLGQRHLPGCSRDPAGVRGTFSGPCSVWLGESHKDGERQREKAQGEGFHTIGWYMICTQVPRVRWHRSEAPFRSTLRSGDSQKPTPCRAPERGPRLPPAWEECTGCR